MFGRKSQPAEYPDDIFDSSRMSFGDHLDELRTRMLLAVYGLLFCLAFGFVLDGIGTSVGNPNIGVGKPMIEIITDPVETQVRDFYFRRSQTEHTKKLEGIVSTDADEVERIHKKLIANDNSIDSLNADERKKLLGAPHEMPVVLPVAAFVPFFGDPKPGAPKEIITKIQVYPAYLSSLSNAGDAILGSKKYLATLSAQEAFVVYFKVSLICGFILGSPWILFQFWAFVGAGLYPHEKRYVGLMVWPSVILFLGGVIMCQFLVLPNAVRALLKFNEWLGFDPDIRLNEWLGLALILPLVFGLSFQTPLVMIALNRLGMFTAADYVSKWRGACFLMALFAAVITPTPDVVTMMYLFTPMFGLYMLGIAFCYYFPGSLSAPEEEEAAEEIAV
jgi:sec-independent protein translocase protein TatC